MSIDPSAKDEEDTEYDGFLSYAAEWHAASIGAGAGLTGGLLYGTEYQWIGLLPFAFVILAALGNKKALERFSDQVAYHLKKESWYGIGFAVIFFLLGILIQILM